MPGLEQSLQGAPVWYQEAAKARMERAAGLARRRLEFLNVLSPEERQRLEGQLAPFLALKKGPEGASIPFSITGYSEPINLTPDEIQRIIVDSSFARKVFSEATGLPKVTRGDLEDLRRRAIEEYEIARPSLGQKEAALPSQPLEIRGAPKKALPGFSIPAMAVSGNFPSSPSGLTSALSAPSAPSSSSVAPPSSSEIDKLKEENRKYEDEILSLEHWKKTGGSRSYQKIPIGSLFHKEFNRILNIQPFATGSRPLEAANAVEKAVVPELRKRIEDNQKKISQLQSQGASSSSSSSSSPSSPSGLFSKPPKPKGLSLPTESPSGSMIYSPSYSSKSSEVSGPSAQNFDIFKRAAAAREIEKLLGRRATIAPMNERHEQAKRMLDQSLEDDTLELAQAELRKAQKHSPLATIKPYVESSQQLPGADLPQYMNQYQKNVIEALKDESRESLLEDIIPRINAGFAQHGAFQSGARVEAIRKAASAKDKALRREIASLLHHGYEQGMAHSQAARNRALSAAEVMGRATKEEQEASRAGSEHLRQQALTKHGLTHSNIAALGQVARAQQEQAQNEIAARERQFEREQMHDWEQLARESAIASGTPVAVQNLGVSSAGPVTPPNMYNLAGGALGALSGLLQQQGQRGGYAKGGSVRGHYDEGGQVPYGNDLESEIRGFMAQEDARNHQRLQEAQKHNPIMSWIAHAGQAMLANPRGDPLTNLGHGLAGSLHDMEASKERVSNLYDKINQSRLHQYQILASFENQKAQRAHQAASLEATQDYRQKQLELQLAKLNQGQSHHNQKMSIELEKLRSKGKGNEPDLVKLGGEDFVPITSKSEKLVYTKDKKALGSVLGMIDNIEKKYNEYEKYTKNNLINPMAPYGVGKAATAVRDVYGYATNNERLKKEAALRRTLGSQIDIFSVDSERKLKGGVLSDNTRKFFNQKGVLPSLDDPPDVFHAKLNAMKEHVRENYEAADLSLKYNAHIDPLEIEKMKGKKEEASTSKGGMVSMLDPNGEPLDVPESDVEEAIKAGATLAE